MKAVRRILELIYPPKCPFCGRILEHREDGLCPDCQRELPWTKEGEAGKNIEFCDGHFAPLWYRGRVPEAVHRYKFRKVESCGRVFGTLMAQCLADRWDGGAELITWVPLSRKRLRERGFDQARVLCRRVSELSGIPMEGTLEKTRETKVQSRLTENSARRANVQGAYRLLPGANVAGKRILLVDDVATSGATLSECAACLRLAGAASVTALTLARAGK